MTSRLPIALDAMGGDNAPASNVEGAIRAAAEGIDVLLVGRPDDLGGHHGLEVHPASEVIGMGDDPARSVRARKDSSLVRAAELVRDGRACAMVSAGNTGATVASALLRMGRMRGVTRPCIAAPIPVPSATPTTLVDAGAMVECQPEWLRQFAVMGSIYATERFGIDAPRVGLLSVGEEAGKGTALVREAHALLLDAPLRFVGNVEGRDIMSDAVDVVVTDGFTGNVTLKSLEGALTTFSDAVIGQLARLGDRGAEAVGALAPLAGEMHPDTHGGALLLGTEGMCVISHGSSSPTAVVNALRVAVELVSQDLIAKLAAGIGQLEASTS